MTERCKPYVKKIERLQVQNEDLLKINAQLRDENKELKKQNENLLEKLKYTCDKINYSDKLREMIK